MSEELGKTAEDTDDASPVAEGTPRARGRARGARRSHPWRKALVGVGVFVVVALLAVAGYAAYLAFSTPDVAKRLAVSDYEAGQLAEVLDPPPSSLSTEPIYILLVGDDRRSEPQARSDALILARIDPVKKSAIMLSIARDTRVPIPGHGVSKINAAHSWGGPALAVQTVKDFTGLPVNHYVTVDFDGLTDVVDVLGGLWIDVDRVTKMNYWKPGDPLIEKGYQKLTGEQCLLYVRSRWFPESDWVRCLHQRVFLKALVKQTQQTSPTKQMLIIGIASKNVKSDMTVRQMVDVARAMKGAKDEDIIGRTVPGTDKKLNGVWYALPDEAKTRLLCDYMSRGEVPPGSENWGVQ